MQFTKNRWKESDIPFYFLKGFFFNPTDKSSTSFKQQNVAETAPQFALWRKVKFHSQFHRIAWDSNRNVPMNLTFNWQACPTELGTLTDFLAANVTLAWCYHPQDQNDLYQADNHYCVQSNLLGTKKPNDSNTVADVTVEAKLTLRGRSLRMFTGQYISNFDDLR